MSDPESHPFGLPGGGLPGGGLPGSGIPGAAPSQAGPSLAKPVFQVPAPAAQPPSGAAMVLAPWGNRFAAHIIDWFIRLLFASLIAVAGFLIFADHPFSDTLVYSADGTASATNPGGIFAVASVIYFLSAFLYAPIAMNAMQGATPGKKLVGIRVVMEHGGPPSFAQAFLREPIIKGLITVSSLLVVPYLLNYLWPLWDDESRAGHDHAASTRVVSDQTQSYTAPPSFDYGPPR